ncbi:hypothetical protein WN48_02535 [Eufriesea mexicana]|uniref:Uncharacterized protein n=1 Tax=Eufriesea mexicana TaxID=516756 RepID=A0A310SFR9_9HYME|nr:hypothetical protein WN48_02535 [Eufriesea mexicana]
MRRRQKDKRETVVRLRISHCPASPRIRTSPPPFPLSHHLTHCYAVPCRAVPLCTSAPLNEVVGSGRLQVGPTCVWSIHDCRRTG